MKKPAGRRAGTDIRSPTANLVAVVSNAPPPPSGALSRGSPILSLSGFVRVGLDQQRRYCRDELGRRERLADGQTVGDTFRFDGHSAEP